MNLFQKIFESFSLSGFFWNVVAGLVTSFFITLFSTLTSKNKAANSQSNAKLIEKNGKNGACLISLISVVLFFLLILFKDTGIAQYLNFKVLINIFLISYGIFLVLHLIHSVKLIRNKELLFGRFFQDFVFMLLFMAILTLVLLYFKLAVDSLDGITNEEEEMHSQIINSYLLPLAQLAMVCIGILLPGVILKMVRVIYKK